MRIDSVRSAGVSARGNARPAARGAVFNVDETGSGQRAAAAAPMVAASSIDALLALQAVEDPMQGKKRMLRRGRSLLDMLDALKADLLAGNITPGRLDQLMLLMAQAREQTQPGLDALLDEIELRARVELAKRGLFPGL